MVILAIPFDAVPDAVKGVKWDSRIVVDATNAIDLPAFTPRDLKGRPSTQALADAVPGARVAKAFNTLFAARLGQTRRRRAALAPSSSLPMISRPGPPSLIPSRASAPPPSLRAATLKPPPPTR